MIEFGFSTVNLFFAAELIIAELMFLWPAAKERSFALKFCATTAALFLIAAFFPRIVGRESFLVYSAFSIVRFLMLFSLSYLVMYFSFDIEPEMLLPMCTAGYAVQHLSYRVSWLVSKLPILTELNARERWLEVAVMAVMYVILYLTFGRFSKKKQCWKHSDRRFNTVSIVTIIICVGLTRLYVLFGEDTMSNASAVYAIVACLLALYIQFNLYRMTDLESENRTMERVHAEEKKQYEITKNTIDSINIKLHDAKHKISAYNGRLPESEIDSIKRDIDIYDSLIKTGSEPLDVLITEKSLACQKKGIRLGFSGDGSVLSFMNTMDIYSLFGNALDNAIEATEKLTENDKKLIDVTVEKRGDMVFISTTNYYTGSLDIVDGLPKTSKSQEPGWHGFGMKSMRQIAEKYGGGLGVSTHGELFSLNIYLQSADN